MTKVKAEFAHSLTSWDVRDMCIRYDLYTRGDNEAYSKMLDKCNTDHATPELLEEIAVDITNHSDTDKDFFTQSGYDSVYDAVTTALLCLVKTRLEYFI